MTSRIAVPLAAFALALAATPAAVSWQSGRHQISEAHLEQDFGQLV